MSAGYPINWAFPKQAGFTYHPLYIKYNNQPFSGIDLSAVKADLGSVIATAESSAICAYLAWLIRIKNLLA